MSQEIARSRLGDPGAELVDGLGRPLVRGEEDDQLLSARGELARLAEQPQFASGPIAERVQRA